MTERQRELIRRRLEGKTVALHTDAFEEETEAIRALLEERDCLLDRVECNAEIIDRLTEEVQLWRARTVTTP